VQDLEGRVAVITGSASGMGRATALALARCGVRIVLADIDCPGIVAVAGEIAAAGGEAIAVSCDVADEDAFTTLRSRALDRFRRIDIVMNNVGVMTRGLPDHIPLEEWQRILTVNLMSVVRSNEAFLPYLIERKQGHIVNTASFAGLMTYSYDRLPYAASKAAIVQISEGLAIYLRPLGIGVTLLCPGPVATNIMSSLRSFGPATDTRGPGPQFPLLDAATVGEQVVDAILSNRFFLPTDPQVIDMLSGRATDWDGFIERQIAEPFVVARASK
jgi:NAD(P)-dependent dehydrogenase (short-subunit alcohol dehydrogenase family)